MDSCPVELIARIASLACTDGGRTGCSLSLVSLRIRDATSRERYKSVALADPSRILAFSDFISSSPTKPIVHHLFVSTKAAQDEEAKATAQPGEDASDDDNEGDDNEGDGDTEANSEASAEESDKDPRIDPAIAAIVTSSSSSLITLFIYDPRPEPFVVNSIAADFPSLKSLAVPTYDPPPLDDAISKSRFQTLARLHITSYTVRNLRRYFRFWQELAAASPSLTHLRLSNVGLDGRLASFIRVLLDIPPYEPPTINGQRVVPVAGMHPQFAPGSKDAIEAAATAAMLPNLKHVYVQPGTYKQKGWCGTGYFAHMMTISGLYGLVAATPKDRKPEEGHFYFIGEKRYTASSAMKDWMDVVCGGDGPWTAPSTEDSEREDCEGESI